MSGPGELDLIISLFRQQKVKMTLLQRPGLDNDIGLSTRSFTPATVSISAVSILNPEEGLFRFQGYADLCVDNKWFGRHTGYHLVAEFNVKSRTGSAMIWHE